MLSVPVYEHPGRARSTLRRGETYATLAGGAATGAPAQTWRWVAPAA